MSSKRSGRSEQSEAYLATMNDIAKGAATLRATMSDEQAESSYHDQEHPFNKMPVEALCLKLAYQVWNDMQHTCNGPVPPQVMAQIMADMMREKEGQGGSSGNGGRQFHVMKISPEQGAGNAIKDMLNDIFSNMKGKRKKDDPEPPDEDKEKE